MNSASPEFKTFASRQSLDVGVSMPPEPPKVLGLTELRRLVDDDNYQVLAHPDVYVEYFGITDHGEMVPVYPVFWEDTTDSPCLTHTVSLGASNRLAGFSINAHDWWGIATEGNLAVSMAAVEAWEMANHWVSDDDRDMQDEDRMQMQSSGEWIDADFDEEGHLVSASAPRGEWYETIAADDDIPF